ncbi:MAG TPA: oligosaccharide flippase family protein [Candidatus Binatus sp.]|nr:oligosaccharide flippase family protein [Candidatus Binatus sp.]
MVATEQLVAPSGLGRGAAWGLAGVGLEKLVALGIALYLPRHLSLADYGRYAFLVSYLGFFQALPDASLEAVTVARLARLESGARTLAGGAALVRLMASLAGGSLGLAVVWLATGDAQLVRAGTVAAGGLVALAANPYRPLLRAHARMARYVVLAGGQALLAVGLLAAVVRAGGGLLAVFAATSAAAVGGLALGRVLVGRGAGLRADPGLVRSLAGEGWPLAGTTLVLLGGQQLVQLLLLRLHGAEEVAFLGAAQRLVEALGLLPRAFMLTVLPALSRAAREPVRAAEAASVSVRLLVVLLVPPTVLLMVWGEPVLRIAFGTRLAPAAPVLGVLAPAGLLGATGVVLTNLLLVLGLQRALLGATTAATLVMVALGLALVRPFGAVGAATALIAALLGGQLILLALPGTRAPIRTALRGVIGPLALGVLAGVGATSLRMSLGAGIGLLLLAYPVALVLTRIVTPADLARWRR